MSTINLKPNEVSAPTIFIGLGGTGGDIVRGVAEMCREEETRNIEFVCLDTNANDLTLIKKSKAQIRYVQTSNTQTVGDYLDYDLDARRNWFPKNSVMYDKTVSEGAGQVRAISRLALNATIKTGKIAPLYEAIDDLFRKNGQDLKQALRVVLVSTASGGTGSGIILPISMMIREYVKTKYPNTALLTRGLVLLPETLDSVISSTQERESQRRNAYATIKELNAFMMKGSGFFEIDEDLKRYKNMCVDYVAADGTKKSLALLPMDFCFLMDGQDAEDSTMINFEQYKKLASQALYEQNIGPMQKSAFSVEDNIIKELSAPGNLGRNRFGGIGSSVLKYPYEDIVDYVAYGWALDNIGSDGESGRWGKYDKKYELRYAEAKKKGVPISERPTRSEIYISTIKEGEDPFSTDIKNMYLGGIETDVVKFMGRLSTHVQDALNNNRRLKEARISVQKLGKEIDYKDTSEQGQAKENLSKLRKYEVETRMNVSLIASSLADSLFENDTPTINEERDYMIESLLQRGNEVAHPVAARYIIYYLLQQFEKKCDALKSAIDSTELSLKNYAQDADKEGKYDLGFTPETEVRLDDVCDAELDEGQRPTIMQRVKGYNDIYEILNDCFPKYQKLVTKLGKDSAEYIVYSKGVEFLRDVCGAYEKFFASFKEKVSSLHRKRADLVEILRYKKGDSVRNVCAEEDVLRELAMMTTKQSSESSMLDKELNAQIFDAIKANVAFERELRFVDAAEQDKSIDIFEETMLDYFRRSVRKNCENLDVNIVEAIALEYRLQERSRARKEIEYAREMNSGSQKTMVDHVDKEKSDRYILDMISLGMRLAAPGIQRINNEEPREVRCAAYHESLDSMRDYTMSSLFGKGVSAKACDSVSPYEMHFFIALYNLTPDKLNKFASPLVAETRIKNAGLYQNAYMNYAKHLGPDSTKNMMISTHIDKRWDSIVFMPEIDMAYMSKQMMKIHQSLIYALVYNAVQYRSLSAAAGGKMVYRYENSDERTLDLVVSNGTLCDEFYEVLDALYIDASVVEDISKLKQKRTERDLLRNSNYEKTLFAKAVKEFELPCSIHEGSASLFEIPLGYYNSLPNSQRFSGEIAGLVSAVVQTLREEIANYENEDDVKFILCDILKEQFTLLMENYDKHHINKPASENIVIDLIYRKIRSVVSETPEPDDYESILDEMKSMIR